jgi:hypothetical protein
VRPALGLPSLFLSFSPDLSRFSYLLVHINGVCVPRLSVILFVARACSAAFNGGPNKCTSGVGSPARADPVVGGAEGVMIAREEGARRGRVSGGVQRGGRGRRVA